MRQGVRRWLAFRSCKRLTWPSPSRPSPASRPADTLDRTAVCPCHLLWADSRQRQNVVGLGVRAAVRGLLRNLMPTQNPIDRCSSQERQSPQGRAVPWRNHGSLAGDSRALRARRLSPKIPPMASWTLTHPVFFVNTSCRANTAGLGEILNADQRGRRKKSLQLRLSLCFNLSRTPA